MMAQPPPSSTLFIVNRFYHPDHSATAQIASDLGAYLAAKGWSVCALASRYRYEPGPPLLTTETVDGVTIRRLHSSGFGRTSKVGRLIDYASFTLLAFLHTVRHARRDDIVICKTDPPLLSVSLAIASRLRGARLVNWLQDLFPEVATTMLPRPLFAALAWARNRSLKAARHNVAIGEAMRARLERAGVSPQRITVIANWTDEDIAPVAPADNALRRSWGFDTDTLVVSYSGNLGFAHDYATIVDAAERLAGNPAIQFLMIGGGGGFTALQAAVERRGLGNFHFRPYQPRSDLSLSLGVGDVHWLSLKPELEGLIVPSKLYGILAAGRPYIFVGDTNGEVGQCTAQHGGGTVIAPGDDEGLATLLLRLAPDRNELADQAERALAASHHYRRPIALKRWHSLLVRLASE
ncbi:MAG: glycosyltransferase family 4 protein [Sphingopyxis sp.]